MGCTSDDIAALTGATVVDADGRRVGRIGLVYVDPDGAPSWATVRTGFLGTSESFFPLDGSAFEGRSLHVPFSSDLILRSPRVESEEELTAERSDELHRHYAAPTADGSTTDVEMTLSEERPTVGLQTVERGRVRLRKHVVSEQRTVTVPIGHDEATLVREPITEDDPASEAVGMELTEADYEVVLHGDVVIANTRTVPVERIRLSTRRVTEERQISGEVRTERLETIDERGRRR